jgi:phosphoribosylformylglycinamidine synthase
MPTIVVDVMPKAELLDPQGKAVAGALARLGTPGSRASASASGSS